MTAIRPDGQSPFVYTTITASVAGGPVRAMSRHCRRIACSGMFVEPRLRHKNQKIMASGPDLELPLARERKRKPRTRGLLRMLRAAGAAIAGVARCGRAHGLPAGVPMWAPTTSTDCDDTASCYRPHAGSPHDEGKRSCRQRTTHVVTTFLARSVGCRWSGGVSWPGRCWAPVTVLLGDGDGAVGWPPGARC